MAKYNHTSDMQKIRNLRAEVFQHTVAVVKKGYYTLEGKKYVLASEDVLSMIKNTCYYDKSFDVKAYPSFEGETMIAVENSLLLILRGCSMRC